MITRVLAACCRQLHSAALARSNQRIICPKVGVLVRVPARLYGRGWASPFTSARAMENIEMSPADGRADGTTLYQKNGYIARREQRVQGE